MTGPKRVDSDPLHIPENSLDAVIEKHMRDILNQCGWNKSRAAKILGVNRRMLQRHVIQWMKNYNKNKKNSSR